MVIDTHCHIYKEYYEDISSVVKKSNDIGINIIINNGCNLSSSLEVLELSKEYENMYCVVGLHPSENLDEIDSVLDLIIKNVNNKKMIGIGEIGLDYYYTRDNRGQQINIFEKQLQIAQEYNLPVIIHNRDATDDMLRILRKYNLKGVIHCFNGSEETAKEYIKMGYKLGINGVITFKNCKLINVIRNIGIENIVFETDSPYLTPEPYRGKINDPSFVKVIIEFISEKLSIDKNKLEIISNDNVNEIFDINLNS